MAYNNPTPAQKAKALARMQLAHKRLVSQLTDNGRDPYNTSGAFTVKANTNKTDFEVIPCPFERNHNA